MTKLKLDGTPAHGAGRALEPHVPRLYDRLGTTLVAVVELRSAERTQVLSDSGKEPAVKARITSCEVATGEVEHAIRGAMKALHTVRTAEGTLTETMDVELAEQTIKHLQGRVELEEAVRIKVGVQKWLRELEEIGRAKPAAMTPEKYHDKLEPIIMGLGRLVDGVVIPDAPAHDDTGD